MIVSLRLMGKPFQQWFKMMGQNVSSIVTSGTLLKTTRLGRARSSDSMYLKKSKTSTVKISFQQFMLDIYSQVIFVHMVSSIWAGCSMSSKVIVANSSSASLVVNLLVPTLLVSKTSSFIMPLAINYNMSSCIGPMVFGVQLILDLALLKAFALNNAVIASSWNLPVRSSVLLHSSKSTCFGTSLQCGHPIWNISQ